jgi:hypothetical protein
MVGGGAVAKQAPNAAAITPAWRNTISDMIIELPATGDIRPFQQAAHEQLAPIRQLAPPPTGGQYYNEVSSAAACAPRTL